MTVQSLHTDINHDPNERQSLAANPLTSAWVSASAGTGKTKVLTDRVLRLMLPRQNADLSKTSTAATPPDKILCLTYTKAAAAEMADRIHRKLSEWSVMSEDKLFETLTDLLGGAPNAETIQTARALFARVVDTPGGMKIMTLHSFCQSILKRFPLESGLAAHFDLLDDRTQKEYMHLAKRQHIEAIRTTPESPLNQDFKVLSTLKNADQFDQLIKTLNGKRDVLFKMLNHGKENSLSDRFYRHNGFEPGTTVETLIHNTAFPPKDIAIQLRQGITHLIESKKITDNETGNTLADFLSLTTPPNLDQFKRYARGFLTQKDFIKDRICTKDIKTKHPIFSEHLAAEAVRVHQILEKTKTLHVINYTLSLLRVGGDILKRYTEIKAAQTQLDYDDLIDYTAHLLSTPSRASWVLYKMDQGIDHILLDEAQDTSPKQWRIIQSITEDFFSGDSARDDVERTLFVVGDEKQSIYSFLGAEPKRFNDMKQYFQTYIRNAEKQFTPVNLLMSFRSTPAVLKTVDHFFNSAAIMQGVKFDSSETITHLPFRKNDAGHIEIWPLIKAEKIEPPEPWTPPDRIVNTDNAQVRLAHKIAETIASWLDRHTILESKNRPIQAGDIMILFRSRGTLLNHVLRALKQHKIPISGVDRMVLTEHLAVQDCLALASSCLLPSDDLTLATVLKSPFINYSEHDLFNVAYNRKGSLWQNLKTIDPNTYTYIRNLTYAAQTKTPYDFYADVLLRPCPAGFKSGREALYSRLGLDIDDALEEFLNTTLDFEHLHTPILQKFLQWFAQSQTEVKRENEGGTVNHVRLMTVHGSKGLQAPIIFLPDTTSTAQNKFDILWPTEDKTTKDTQKDASPFPLWSPRKDFHSHDYLARKERAKETQMEEYRRLLYVALTRAEDRFYICGAIGGHKKIPEDSWYNRCHTALSLMPNVETIPFIFDEEDGEKDIGETLVYKNSPPKTSHGITPKKETRTERTSILPLPEWANTPPMAEPSPPRPLMPSRPSAVEPAMRSPLMAQDERRFHRGNLTHQLLEFLPNIPPESRAKAATNFLAKPAHDISQDMQNSIKAELLAILGNPDFASLFGKNSRAEVSIVGLLDKTENNAHYALSGQIDRMVVEQDRVLIVDYKSNRPPPTTIEGIADTYWQQMASYQQILQRVYPKKRIECALLWTDGPDLMLMPDDLLKKYHRH